MTEEPACKIAPLIAVKIKHELQQSCLQGIDCLVFSFELQRKEFVDLEAATAKGLSLLC